MSNEELQTYVIEEAMNIQKLETDRAAKLDQAVSDFEIGTIDERELAVALDEAIDTARQMVVRLKFLVANFETACDVPTELVEWLRAAIGAMEEEIK